MYVTPIFMKPFTNLSMYVENIITTIGIFCQSFISTYHFIIPPFFRCLICINMYIFLYMMLDDCTHIYKYRNHRYTFIIYAGIALITFYFGHFIPYLAEIMTPNNFIAETFLLASGTISWILKRFSEYSAIAFILNIKNKDRDVLLLSIDNIVFDTAAITIILFIFIAVFTIFRIHFHAI